MSATDLIKHVERAKALNMRSGLLLIPLGCYFLLIAVFGPVFSMIGTLLMFVAFFYLKKRQKNIFGAIEPSKSVQNRVTLFAAVAAVAFLTTILFDIYENGPAQRIPIYLTPILALAVIVADNQIRRRSHILTPLHWIPAAICVVGALVPTFVDTMNADFLRSISWSVYGYAGNYWASTVNAAVLGLCFLIFGYLDHRNQVKTVKAPEHAH